MPGLEGIAKFFGVAPDPMLVVDSGGLIVLANAQTYTLFGYQLGELVGQGVERLLPSRYHAQHGDDLTAYFRSPATRPMGSGLELSARRLDGSEFPVEVSLSPYVDRGAQYAIASIRDISERKNLEEAQRELRRQKRISTEQAKAARILSSRNDVLKAIFAASPLGMITTTKEGIIEHWNRAAEKIYGYSASEAMAMSIWEMIRLTEPEDGVPIAAVDRENQIVHEVTDVQTRRRRKDNKIIDISLSSAAYHDPLGQNSGFVFLIDDISERKAMEQQLTQAQKMEAVGQLTGGVAHDFNNLLSVIICSLELLRETPPFEPEHIELSGAALSAAFQGAELIKQLLAFSRKQNLNPKTLDVNLLVKSMTTLLARSLGEQIEVDLQVEHDLWPAVADPVQLQTALVNLATNARDAMPEGGKLTIQTENAWLDEAYVEPFVDLKAGPYSVVAVSDTGQGMPQETVERAFDPFFTTKPPGVGTGLGLSMVFGFVKQSGGHVRIYSEVGHGTTVRLYLPRAQAAPLPTVVSSVPVAKQRQLFAGKVLIVEDNMALAKSAHRLIRDSGFDATIATTATEALGLLSAPNSFDVLFTDVILAHGENGIQLASDAMKANPQLKVLFASGFAETMLRESGKGAVEGNFIAKPYRREDLISRIEGLMNAKRS